jgi:DNA polymerase III subunit gamma/tau
VPVVQGATASATRVPEVPRTALGERWADVVARMLQQGLITALVRELAIQAECVGVQDLGDAGQSVWRLRVERESLRSEANRDRLAAAVQKVLGGVVGIELEAGVARDTVSLRDQAARASRQVAAEALIQQDPLVQSLLAQFPGARVLPGSIAPLA